MVENITYAFNSTSEFFATYLHNISFAFGGGAYAGIFMWAFATYIVHRVSGAKASVPAGLGFAVLLANAGMLPAWISPAVIMLVSIMFGAIVYEKTLARRR